MGGSVNGLVGKVGNLAGLFKSFGKGGAIGLAIAGAAGLVATISNGIKSSADNTIAWRKQMAQFKPLLSSIDALTERIAGNFITLVAAIQNFGKFVFSGFRYNKVMNELNEETNTAVDLVNREIKNEEELQKLQLDEVTTQNRLNELRAIAADTDRKSVKEREDALRQIAFIETSLENRRINAAKEAYDIQVASRKGEKASLDEQKKERELWIAYQQTIVDAQKNQIDREKELYQLQKNAGEEALDYRIRILESERNLLETQISMVEANTIEEYNLRRQVADKEYEIAVATADKEKKNMTLKNKQLLEAQLNYQRDLQQIEEDFTAGYLQRIKDQTDAAVATTVDEWKKSLPKFQGLLNEYRTKLQGGKPVTQTTDEWLKELAVLREAMRKTYLGGLQDAFEKIDEKIKLKLQDTFNVWEQGTAKYMYAEIQQFQHMYDVLALERETVLADAKQLEGESDEEYAARRAEIEKFYDLKIIEARKKIVEDYQKWYYQSVKETDTEVILSSKKLYEDYVNGIPHSVWDYMFKPTDNTMDQLQTNLDNAKSRFEAAKRSIEVMFVDLWDEETMGEFDFNKAFDLLPDDIQKDYLAKLEDYKDKEQVILKQRLDN